MKLSNTARSISEIASHASLFVPITMQSTMLPSYITLNPKSQWHVSGLLSMAMECMTLPSRMKSQAGHRETLDDIANTLNVNGNQNIAKLRMSIDQSVSQVNGDRGLGRLEVRAQSRDLRVPSQERVHVETDTSDKDYITTFDMDFFPVEAVEQTRGRLSTKETHVFGQAENYRSDQDQKPKETNEDEDSYERARCRAAGLPIIYKSVHKKFPASPSHACATTYAFLDISYLNWCPPIFCFSWNSIYSSFLQYSVRITYCGVCRTRIPMSFPILDSFPHIFAQEHVGTSPRSLSVNTALSTDTSVALRIKNLQSIISGAISVDERETLSNSLGEIAEAYEEGWDSGSDEDDD